MGRVAKARKIGIVRRDDKHLATWPDDPVELFHRLDDVRDVFDYVDSLQPVKSTVTKRIRESIKLDQNIRPRGRITVDPDGAGQLIDSAADVENSQASIVPQLRRNKVDINTLRLLYSLALMC